MRSVKVPSERERVGAEREAAGRPRQGARPGGLFEAISQGQRWDSVLHDEIDARADEWREGLTSNRLSAMPNEIREEDRDRLRANGMTARDLGVAMDVLMDGRVVGEFKEELAASQIHCVAQNAR